ncbi:MAG: caspase family protein [Gemmobacter sp.]
MRRLLLGTALALLALPMAAFARDNHAILIGANTYDNLDPRFWLKGPSNDVALVATYLTTAAPVPFDAANVTVLADGVAGAPAPTLAAIRAAFADLAERVQPGDFVYLHFSGHGSQAPASDPDSELDGLDELFLPVDVGPWNDTVGAVENALVDDEIGQMLDALTARGADVWVVFDSCHSGTATRAAPSGDDAVMMRQLPPEALGLTADRMAEAEAAVTTRALPDPRARPVAPVATSVQADARTGSIVAFFAAQTNEVTPEKNLPKGRPGRVPQGVFTYTLFESLAEYPGATYGQIAQEVLRKYSVKNLARSTPLFEGDLDRVVFGGEAAPRLAQWPATRDGDAFVIPAGTLHGLSEGSTLAVLASAADPSDAALARVTVTRADTFGAEAAGELPADLPRGVVLRKLSSDLDFSLTVAMPEAGSAPADALMRVVERLRAAAGARLRFVAPGDEADLRLAVMPESPRPDAIWVLPATGLAEDLTRTPSVSTGDKGDDELAEVLADTLTRMAKALNLLKMGGAVGQGNGGVEIDLLTRDPANRTLRGLDMQGVPRLIPDDEVHVEATNTTDGPMDLNVLYIGSDWSITHMFAGRLHPGDTLKKGLLRITDEAFGRDRIVMVMTPARPQSAVENLGFLAQEAVEVTRGGSVLAAALREAGFGETTRAAVSLEDDTAGPAPMILQFEIDTVPAG